MELATMITEPDQALGSVLPVIHPDQPELLAEINRRGAAQFAQLPMPRRTDQAWRFTTLGAVALEGFAPAPAVPSEQAELLAAQTIPESAHAAGRITFVNDTLSGEAALAADLRARGVIWMPLRQAVIEHSERVRQHLAVRETGLGAAKFSALHRALLRAGTFLHVPRNTELVLPLHAFHWMTSPGAAIFPHTLIVADENSRVTVVDHFRSADPAEAGFACAVSDIVAAPGAKVTYVCVQDWSERSTSLQLNTVRIARDAAVTTLHMNLGSAWSRVESRSFLSGEGGRSDMLALGVASGKQEFDLRTFQDHLAPGAMSDLLYKNALADKARTIFAGLIRVERGAHRTDAYQTNRNLLLSDEAEANSMPGLEILADDVKCSHGATTAQLSSEEMFYLNARGIPSQVGRQLLVAGFLGEVLERLGDRKLADSLLPIVDAKFKRMRLATTE